MGEIGDPSAAELPKTENTQSTLEKKVLMFIYLPLGILLSQVTPDNILEYPWAGAYTSFMAGWLPYVAEVGRWTPEPATQFISAVMNLAAIVWCLLVLYVELRVNLGERVRKFGEMSRVDLISSFLIVILLGFYAFRILFPDSVNILGKRGMIMIGSKLGMGVLGSVYIVGLWFVIELGILFAISIFILLKRHLAENRN